MTRAREYLHALIAAMIVLGGSGTVTAAAQAQIKMTGRDSLAISRLLSSARTELVQTLTPLRRTRQDALADTLVAIALAPSSANIAREVQSAAVSTLAYAGSRGVANAYAGTAARLLMIAQRSHDKQLQSSALFGLGQLRDTTAAIAALKTLAVYSSAQARWAVRYLGTNYGERGLGVLRELRRDGAVREPTARRFLDQTAETYGWPSGSPSIDVPIGTQSISATPWRAASAPCTPKDEMTDIMLEYVAIFLAKTDSIAVDIRHSLGLPTASASAVKLESDHVTCRAIRRTLDSLVALPTRDTTRRVFIARVDTMFIVNDMSSLRPSLRGGFIVLNRSYAYVGGWR